MVINLTTLLPYLAVLLPIVMPFFGDGLASILAQDGFPQAINDLLAWLFLIVAAIATAIATNKLTGGANDLIGVLFGIVQVLLSGPLTSLKPWVNLSALLQSKVFNVVPAAPTPAPVPMYVNLTPGSVAAVPAVVTTEASPVPVALSPNPAAQSTNIIDLTRHFGDTQQTPIPPSK